MRLPGTQTARIAWATVALTLAVGFLAGAVVAVALHRDPAPRAVTVVRTEQVPATATTGGTVVVRTLVPTLVGEGLDVANQRLDRAGFQSHVDAGGGLFGPVIDSHWQVVAQRPAAGAWLERGSTVHVDIVRR